MADDDFALGWATFYKGWALKTLGDVDGAIATLNASALAFDRAAYVAGAAQARGIADDATRALESSSGIDETI
jgi:hypothetical protein